MGLCTSAYTADLLAPVAGKKYPEPLSSQHEIAAAKPDLDDLDIYRLPLKAYPLLTKFKGLKRIKLYDVHGGSASDDSLKAIARLNLKRLEYLDANNCKRVTDDGIRALQSITSLRELQVEHTSITDASCELMASKMHLSEVAVAECDGVSFAGLRLLASSDTLEQITFSADKLAEGDVLRLIDLFKNIKWCSIIDKDRKLDASLIKARAGARRIHVTIMPSGARTLSP